MENIQSLEVRIAELEAENQQLKTENQAFRSFIKHSPKANAVFDSDMQYLAASDVYLDTFGIADKTYLGVSHYELFPDMAQNWMDAHKTALNGTVIGDDADGFENEDGSWEYNKWECRPWYTSEDIIGGMIMYTEVVTDRVEAAQQLALYKNLTDNAPIGIGVSNLEDTNIMYCNQWLDDMIGRPLMGTSSSATIPEDVLHNQLPGIIEVAQRDGSWTGESKMMREDGTIFPVMATLFISKDDDGNPLGSVVMAMDITEEKAVSESLRLKSQQLKEVLKTAKLGYWNIDLALQTFYLTDEFYHVLGTTAEEAGGYSMPVGRYMGELVHPDDVERVGSDIQRAMTSDDYAKLIEYRIRHTSGDYMRVVVRIRDIQRNEETGMAEWGTGTIQDVTEQREADAERERLASVLELTTDFVGMATPDQKIFYINQTWKDFMDIESEDAVKQTVISDYFSPEHYQKLVQEAMPYTMQHGVWHSENAILSPSGQEIPVLQICMAHKDKAGNLLYISTLARDISEQKQAEQEREQLQQEIIQAQKQALQELSTPIIPLMKGVLVMPLIGSIDTARSRDIMRNLLAGISEHRARTVIVDITGVPVVDSGVADHLNKTIQAARLKGAHTIVSGISDAVAETIVDLGIDWSEVETMRDLQSGLQVALSRLGIEMTKQ